MLSRSGAVSDMRWFPRMLLLLALSVGVLAVVAGRTGGQERASAAPFDEGSHARVAVVGAGISGASAAAFLRELLGEEAEIVVLEQLPRTGGRIHSADIDGFTVELGARQFHSTHYYLSSFVTRFNLTAFDPLTTNSDKLGIWACPDHPSPIDEVTDGATAAGGVAGKECVLEKDESSWKIVNGLCFFWKYLTAPMVAGRAASRSSFRMLDGFITLETGAGARAETAEEMAQVVGMADLMGVSTKDYLLSKWGMTERYVNEVAAALLRLNSGNGIEQNAFSGLLELQQTRGNLYALAQGLEVLVVRLLAAANVELLHGWRVDRLEQEDGEWFLRAARQDHPTDEYLERRFDAVLLATGAAPLGIRIVTANGSEVTPETPATSDVHVTVVVGELRVAAAFGLGDEEGEAGQPQKVLTRGGKSAFFSLIVLGTHPKFDRRVYRITSGDALDDSLLDELFSERGPTLRQAWPQAVPAFDVLDEDNDGSLHSFRLAQGLYSTAAMESLASSLEIQAMTAKNVALLLAAHLVP